MAYEGAHLKVNKNGYLVIAGPSGRMYEQGIVAFDDGEVAWGLNRRAAKAIGLNIDISSCVSIASIASINRALKKAGIKFRKIYNE